MKKIISVVMLLVCILNMILPASVACAEENTEYECIQLPIISDKSKETVTGITLYKDDDTLYAPLHTVCPLINAEWYMKDGGFYISRNNCIYFRYYNDGNMKLIVDLDVGDDKWNKSDNVLLEGNLFSCKKIGVEWCVDFIKFCDMFGVTFRQVSPSTIQSAKDNIRNNIDDSAIEKLNRINIENDLDFNNNSYYIYLYTGTPLISLYAQVMRDKNLYIWDYSCYENLNLSEEDNDWLKKILKSIQYSDVTQYLTIQSQNCLSNLVNDNWGITKLITAPPYDSSEHYKKALVNISGINYGKNLKSEDIESINQNNKAQELERLLNSNTILSSSDSTITILNKYLNDQIKIPELESFTKVSDVINCIGTPFQTYFEVEDFHNKLNSINEDKIQLLTKSIVENNLINDIAQKQKLGNDVFSYLNKTVPTNILLNSIDNYSGLMDSSKEICSLYKNSDKQLKDKLNKSIESEMYALGDTVISKALEESGNSYLVLASAVIGVYDGFTAWTKENFGEQLQSSEILVQAYFIERTMKESLDIKNPENLYNRLILMLQSSLCCFEYDENCFQTNRNKISKMLYMLDNDKSINLNYYHDPRNNNIDENVKNAILNFSDTLVVPIEDETQSTEFVEITEADTTMQTEESAPTIPEEASIYNGHSYVVYPESMTWQEAKEYCEKLGGHLVTISDADEQKFVEELAENCTDKVSYWLGGYYSDSEWKWVDDTKFSYTNWDSWTDGKKEYRQPDNFYGDEYYLRFANKDFTYTDWKSNKGKWNDVSNEADGTNGDVPLDSFGVICEWDYEQSDKSKDKIGEIIIEDGYLNVRDKPSTKGKVIGKLNNQDTVKIISEKDNWYEIEFDGKNGYVSSDYIKLIDNKSNNTSDEKGKEVDSGICGDNLTWSLDSNGLLTIEGKGKMYNYKYSPYDDGANRPPWQSKKIKSLVIKSGVTSIGNHAFNRQDNLSSISIADTVTSIGKEAFFSCDSLGYLFQIPENISSIAESAFGLCCNTRLLYVGKNVTNIEKYSLDSTYLLTIYGYNGTEAQIYAQNNNIPFVCVDDDYGYHGKVSNKNGASFKANAGDKAEEITVIPYDTEISEYDSIGDWALVKYNGKLGYVHKDDLHFEGGFAKPVIYLYPEKKQDISVKVKFKNGDFTCTYPEYNNGWNVTAYPDGRLINKSDNDEYSYLYWEGEGAIQYDFSSGFVVKSEDTSEFLKETLSYMGLTPKEYNEFIVYWLPIMQKNEYNLISFQTDNYEESAKLEISPKPDSMLRVFMAFKEVDENTVVPEQKLETFKRNGFTVIEWGGTEVK